MDRSTVNRVAESIQKTWFIEDWVSRTSTYKQGASRNLRTGTYMRLGPAGESLQNEYRPGEIMYDGRIENDIAILATIGPFPAPSNEDIFTQLLSKASDATYATSSSPDLNWYDNNDVVARPIMYWDGTGADTIRSFQYIAHRGEGTGLYPSARSRFVHTATRRGIFTAPFVPAFGNRKGELKLTVSGDPYSDPTGKYLVTLGTQFALCDENNMPLPGFSMDTFAPYGWDTKDHARSTGPSRHYLDSRAIDYLNATRLRTDERMTIMILLGHSDGGATAVQHEERMQSVIERWRSLCQSADYHDPHFVLVHPWALAHLSLGLQRAHVQSYQKLADEHQDVSFISIAEATGYAFYDGKHRVPNYLDAHGLHWGNEDAVYFFGDIMWNLLAYDHRCSTCYADCDTTTGLNTLDIFDFICFQSALVQGDPYACECDTSTGQGVCDIFDFICFADAFVSGCQ